MKKEVGIIIIVGLFILAYVIDLIAVPLSINLPTPYHFFDPEIIGIYPFTSTSIVIKALGIFLSTLFLLSLLPIGKLAKGATLLVISGLIQLYSLQSVATSTYIIPIEWIISLTLGGVVLLIPTILYLIFGLIKQAHTTILGSDEEEFEENDTSSGNDKQFWNKN